MIVLLNFFVILSKHVQQSTTATAERRGVPNSKCSRTLVIFPVCIIGLLTTDNGFTLFTDSEGLACALCITEAGVSEAGVSEAGVSETQGEGEVYVKLYPCTGRNIGLELSSLRPNGSEVGV